MANNIGWCDKTELNIVTGCTPVSPGCDNCYARRFTERKMHEWRDRGFETILFHPYRLNHRLGRPCVIFANSMYDPGHPQVKPEWLKAILEVVYEHPHHQFVFLTKRPENLQQADWECLPNVTLGVSIESQEYVHRLATIATWDVRKAVSFEPLLGPVRVPDRLLSAIDWFIIGVETGRQNERRPCQANWIRSLIQQGLSVEKPVYVKTFPKRYKSIDPEEQDFFQQFKGSPFHKEVNCHADIPTKNATGVAGVPTNVGTPDKKRTRTGHTDYDIYV